jgi:plastocyanin domain-containing protein
VAFLEESRKMKRILALVVSCVALALVIGVAAPAWAQSDKKVQQVKLTLDDKGNYVVTPSTVTKGVPVKMEVDLQTVKGCTRTVVISAYKVEKTVKDGDTSIEFTPTKSGPVEIACGMKMAKGSLKVVEPAGTR